MIITKLNGGLGNQMFEYAHARNLQYKFGDKMALDVEGFSHNNPKYPTRHFSLDSCHLPEEVMILPLEKSKKLIFAQAISKINRRLANAIFERFRVYVWKTPKYRDFDIHDTKDGNYYFYGYWQSDKYFREYSDVICQELRIKDEPIKDAVPFLTLATTKNATCIHIRRGDYVQGNMITCDERYYLSGMKYVRDKVGNCTFLVFSDDINWVKNNIHFEYPVTYVTLDNPDYEVLRIMYSCNHFVMSNSSFSWWAQFLCDKPDKIVFAPSVWFPNMPDEKSIYQDNWIVYAED